MKLRSWRLTFHGTKWFNPRGNTGCCNFILGAAQDGGSYDLSTHDVRARSQELAISRFTNGTTWTTLEREPAKPCQPFSDKQYSITNFRPMILSLNITANNGDASGIQLSEMAFPIERCADQPDGTPVDSRSP